MFKDVDFIHGRRQPPNILRQISNAAFITGNHSRENGIFHCKNSNCKICTLYLQACKSFNTRRGIWDVKCYINCNSKNAIYFQVCNFCNRECNIGKTDDLRERTNNHITGSRHGTTTNKFDQHNYWCSRKQGIEPTEPYFKLYVFMVLNDYSKLRAQERHLHLQNHDTINSTNNLWCKVVIRLVVAIRVVITLQAVCWHYTTYELSEMCTHMVKFYGEILVLNF